MNHHAFYSNSTPTSFLAHLKSCLTDCVSFSFSVSFIKRAGLDLFYDDLLAALRSGAKGRILTSTYQNFTDCHSLNRFLDLQEKFPGRFECHLEDFSFGQDGFHTKGYLFEKKDGTHEVIIGSSNITRFALLYNKEWDVSILSNPNDPFLLQVRSEFDALYQKTFPLSKGLIDSYSQRLQYAVVSWDMDEANSSSLAALRPNLMQSKALRELRRQRSMGHERALVVAATGSGKTFLAAFDAKNFDAKRLLFVVHKDAILVSAQKTFQSVFKTTRSYGLFTGETGDGAIDADFIFATTSMLRLHRNEFDPKAFDYIVIDEVHHSAAKTYQDILHYFKPEFLLGLTATPERMDGKSIYDLFQNNVPFDLRLREAIENNLIVPFHYFGIKDSLLNYSEEAVKNKIGEIAKSMCGQENCAFIDGQIRSHRKRGEKLRCVGFCSTRFEAQNLADIFAKKGYSTAYLDGGNTTSERLGVFRRLESEDDPLNLVFAIDILNEGVDIPSINMVLFLRPTESSTIFIQQLGRGLRKYPGKAYLTVLDFIANSYQRSCQIAAALGSLSRSGTVDQTSLADGVRTSFASLDLPGVEIHFDEESQEEILRSIEKTNFNRLDRLCADYRKFKDCLVKQGAMKESDYVKPTCYLDASFGTDFLRFAKYPDCYADFLAKADPHCAPSFPEESLAVLRFLNFFLPLVRAEEFAILSSLLEGGKTEGELEKSLSQDGFFSQERFRHALNVLSGNAVVNATGQKRLIRFEDGEYSLAFPLASPSFEDYLRDVLEYGLSRFRSDFASSLEKESASRSPVFLHPFGFYTQPTSFLGLCVYSRDGKANLMPMSGIHYTKKGLALYITLNKDLQKEERLKYKDKFLSPSSLQWESSTGTALDNGKGKRLQQEGKAMIFVRKTKKSWGRMSPFIYIGMGDLENPRTSDNPAQTLLFDIILENPVPEAYRYDLGIEEEEEYAPS